MSLDRVVEESSWFFTTKGKCSKIQQARV